MWNKGKKYTAYFVICFGLLNMEAAYAAAFGQFSSLFSQTPASYKGGILKLDQTDAVANMALSPSKTNVLIKESGVYFVTAVGTVGAMVIGGKGYVDFWFIKNGVPIPNSNGRVAIPEYAAIASVTTSFITDLVEGDELSISYSSSSPSIGFIFIQPDNEPAMNSITLSIFTLAR